MDWATNSDLVTRRGYQPLLTRRDSDNINWPGSDLRWLLRAGSASPPSEIRLKKSDKC